VNAKAPHAARGLALCSTVVLAGCSASARLPADPPGTAERSPDTATRWPAVETRATSDQTKVEAADAPTVRVNRPGSLIGLYGELLSDPSPATGPFDGSSNVSQVTFATEGACSDPEIDSTGKWLVFASTQHRDTSDVYLKSIPGRTLTQLTTDPADDVMPAFHPSGAKIAFASNRAGNWDVYVMSREGGQPMKITDEPEHELHPSWSPDGERLIYCKLGSKSGRWEMWVVDITNPGVRRFLDYGLFPQWCPDVSRSKILLQRARQRGSRYFSVWTVDYVNGDAVHPTEIVSAGNAAVINPAWSPDGSRVVFVTVVEPEESSAAPIEQSDIWIAGVDGAGRTNLTNGRYANFQPVWSNDGRVYFVSNRTGVDNIWAVTTHRALDAIVSQPANLTTAVPPLEPEPPGRRP
jgi:TolB protein